jgi:hypothetical protein
MRLGEVRVRVLGVWRNERGAAAAELVLWLAMLTPVLLNVFDISFYAFQRMQVEVAAKAAVEEAWHLCNTTATTPGGTPPGIPIATCKTNTGTDVATAMQTAAQKATELGTAVTVPSSTITEGYYCTNGSGALVQVGTAGNAGTPGAPGTAPTAPTAPNPNDCTGVIKNDTSAPGDYVVATATYTNTPVFAAASVVSLLPSPITRQAWLRLDK